MTQEDIIRMARAAGGADITCSGWTSWVGTQSTEFLERFAALVRADERVWVGLTDEKVIEISHLALTRVQAVQMTEAILKEKNT
jgi:hypothetical protein